MGGGENMAKFIGELPAASPALGDTGVDPEVGVCLTDEDEEEDAGVDVGAGAGALLGVAVSQRRGLPCAEAADPGSESDP